MIDIDEVMNAARAAPRAKQERADGSVQLHDMEAKCLELAARAAEPKLRKQFLKMARLFQTDAELLAKSRACIAESERLLASIRADSESSGNVLASSRACIAESERLIAMLPVEPSTAPIEPDLTEVRTRLDGRSTMLSVRVFQKELGFRWTLNAPSDDVLGRGTAETEQQARIDALQAGMTYIDRAKGRSSPSNTNLH